jgi:hypothetical protein
MRNMYSTPTVSFADRSDFRPRVVDPFQVMMTYRTKQSVPWSSDRRGFFVAPRDVRLMSSWLKGKL